MLAPSTTARSSICLLIAATSSVAGRPRPDDRAPPSGWAQAGAGCAAAGMGSGRSPRGLGQRGQPVVGDAAGLHVLDRAGGAAQPEPLGDPRRGAALRATDGLVHG